MPSQNDTWRFLLDENLPKRLWKTLQEEGYSAARVKDERLQGQPDSVIFRQVRLRAIILTRDKDFLKADLFPTPHSGIIVLSLPSNTPIVDVIAKVMSTLKMLAGQDLTNKVYIIEPDQVRLHSQ